MTDEKWKARARALFRQLLNTTSEQAVPLIAAALAEAYEEGREAERYKPGPKVEEYPGD